MVKVVFIKNFATKKKGDEWVCDAHLANTLVRVDKVAKYHADTLSEFDLIKKKGELEEKRVKEQEAKKEAARKSRIAATIKAEEKLRKEGK